MGADLLLVSAVLPRRPDGTTLDPYQRSHRDAVREALKAHAQIRVQNPQIVGEILEQMCRDADDFEGEPATDTSMALSPSDEARNEVLETLWKDLDEVWVERDRSITITGDLLQCGGTSHGDSPSDAFDSVIRLAIAGVTDCIIDVSPDGKRAELLGSPMDPSTIVATTFTYTVLHRADEPLADLDVALREADTGNAVGAVVKTETVNVPDLAVPGALLALGNDGEFFDHDLTGESL